MGDPCPCKTRYRSSAAATVLDVNMASDELGALFPWWVVVDDRADDVFRVRALAWLVGPAATAAAVARLGPGGDPNSVLQVLRDFVSSSHVPERTTPVEMEAWLSGLVDGCAVAMSGGDAR